jgi:hypothetical protein
MVSSTAPLNCWPVPCSMCAPVLGAGRNGPYMEEDRGERQEESNGNGLSG